MCPTGLESVTAGNLPCPGPAASNNVLDSFVTKRLNNSHCAGKLLKYFSLSYIEYLDVSLRIILEFLRRHSSFQVSFKIKMNK